MENYCNALCPKLQKGEYCNNCIVKAWLNNQPTAYDMDKVVEQLEELGQKMSESKSIQKYGESSPANHGYYKAVSVKRAIEIVKGGGVDMKNNMKCCTQGNADNIDKAVEGLDIFTKNWCMNCAETEKTNDLVFRCKECDFAEESGSCRIKWFVNKHKSNYPLDDFGSMGRH